MSRYNVGDAVYRYHTNGTYATLLVLGVTSRDAGDLYDVHIKFSDSDTPRRETEAEWVVNEFFSQPPLDCCDKPGCRAIIMKV
jgi:hypothetical protein